MMTRTQLQRPIRAGVVGAVLVVLLIATNAYSQFERTGIGLQATGSACCISVRHWTVTGTGTELQLSAARNIFVTLRGLTILGGTELVNGYAGAGINLAFGSAVPVPPSPIRSFQFLLGLEFALPFIPPQVALNIEAALELDLQQNFYSRLGSGIHFYF